jgi:hypothetical protein
MHSDNKKPGGWAWGWWLAIGLAALLIVYPLSLGPVEWIESKSENDWLETGIDYFYFPVFLALERFPESVRDVYRQYRNWWVPPRFHLSD